jgi:hypothetical protein
VDRKGPCSPSTLLVRCPSEPKRRPDRKLAEHAFASVAVQVDAETLRQIEQLLLAIDERVVIPVVVGVTLQLVPHVQQTAPEPANPIRQRPSASVSRSSGFSALGLAR